MALEIPAYLVGKDAPDERTEHRRNAIRHSDDASEHGALPWLGHEGDYGVGAGADTGGAEAVDGAADDQRGRVLGDGADEAAELEDDDGSEVDGLEVEVLVGLAPGRLEAAVGHEEGGAVPGDFVEAVELVGDFGDGCGDDGLGRLAFERGGGRGVGGLTMSREARKMLRMRARAMKASLVPLGYWVGSGGGGASPPGLTVSFSCIELESSFSMV